MVVALMDDDVYADSRYNVGTRESFERVRSPKAARTVQKSKKSGTPGSMRLRRNKHWSW